LELCLFDAYSDLRVPFYNPSAIFCRPIKSENQRRNGPEPVFNTELKNQEMVYLNEGLIA